MIKKNLKNLALLGVTLLTLSGLTGCQSTSTPSSSSSAAAVSLSTALAVYSSEDMDASWDASSATTVTLNGSSISVNGSGAEVDGTTLKITDAGTYLLKGTLDDGQIIVSASKDDTVRLVLNGASLTCSDGAAIYAEQAQKTIITLAPGTANSVADGTTYSTSGEDQPDAAIFSQDDLTINGSGSLIVKGNFNNGIGTKDDLVITGGTIDITAANDGLRGRDSVAVNGGTFTINAESDGIQSNNDEDTSKGWVSLDGGTFAVTAGNDGIQAETILQVSGGNITLNTGGGSAAAVSTSDINQARPGQVSNNNTATEETTESAKGMKAGSGIYITDGVFNIDSADDAVHSQGDVILNGGTYIISTGDDGVHSDSNLNINDGNIAISKSYEGLEGMTVTVSGGQISLTSSDDGINAAGGSDTDQSRTDSFKSSDSYEVRVTGGYIYINAGGDGIDSNGNLYFDGGTVLVNGPTNNGNGPLDYNGTCEQTGGILVAAGSSGMAQAPGNTSSQNSLLVYYSSVQKSGTLVNLTDDSGKSLLTFAPAKNYQSIVISMPDLVQGKTYTLYSGGTCTGEAVNGLYTGGTYASGTKLTSVTLTSALTSITDDGSAVTSQGGMNGGPGGQGSQRGPSGSGQAPPNR